MCVSRHTYGARLPTAGGQEGTEGEGAETPVQVAGHAAAATEEPGDACQMSGVCLRAAAAGHRRRGAVVALGDAGSETGGRRPGGGRRPPPVALPRSCRPARGGQFEFEGEAETCDDRGSC